MKILNENIGKSSAPFIIAEVSGNHNQSLDRAFEIVRAIKYSGAHAIKLQTYTADTITLNSKNKEFIINDKNSLWYGKSLYQLYDEAHTPWDWHKPIMDLANDLGLICFSSPFDESAVEFLEDLNVPAYKIASSEIIHLPLIKKVASTKKPIILSTGMASISEIDEAIQVIKDEGCDHIAILKCTASYPSDPNHSNVLTIPHLRKLFNCEVGLSDHTLGIGVPIAAVSHGATIIEKHFTLSREDGGVDSAFSLEPSELKNLVFETNQAWKSLGKISYGPTETEKTSLKFRRSVYISADVEKNEKFTYKNLKIVRPSSGLEPKYFDKLIGKKAAKKIKSGTPMSWDLLV
tara:strand:+ start:1846 stop:2889 length:1044 start_codon:yes stop_codon:yes gene_type:complete